MAGRKRGGALPGRRERAAAGDLPRTPAQSRLQPAVSLVIAAEAAAAGTAQGQALQQTLGSALAQRLQPTQVLLLLPEGTPAPPLPAGAAAEQLQVVACPAGSPAAAWNLGLARSAGAYVAFIEPGALLDEDYAWHLYAQALLEDAELCHGEYALEAPGGAGVCSDAAPLARGDDSPLPCLGVVWTTLWRRSFLEERQLCFEEDFSGGCALVFQTRALLSSRRWALCEDQVGRAAALPQPQLTAQELACRLEACRRAAQLLQEARAQLPQRALVRALAWLVAEADVHLAWQAAAAQAAACHEAAAALAGQCPPQLRQALQAEVCAQSEARAALSAPLYRAIERTVDDPPPPWTPPQAQAVGAGMREQILRCIDPGHDDVYLLLLHLGDAYTWLCYMGTLLRRHGSRNAVVAVWSRQHEELAAMTRPDLPRVLLPGGPEAVAYCERLIGSPQVRVGPFRIFMCPNFHVLHRRLDLPQRRAGFSHKLDNFAAYFGCRAQDCDLPRLRLLPAAEAEAEREAGRHGLDLQRFVMLCPEANSCAGPGWPFWHRLAGAMRARGYGVYVNATRPGTWPPEAGHTFALSFAGACALAFRARRIIILRCGMSEVLAQCGADMDVLHVNSFFRYYLSLSRYPHVNTGTLREYDLSQLGEERCLQLLLERPMP